MEKSEEKTLILDEFYINVGEMKYCLEFIFSDESLSDEFTKIMAEKFGDRITEKWFFYQKKDKYSLPHIPLLGEPCFSLEWGNITGLLRDLDEQDIKEALNMILFVGQDMGIVIKKRKCVNLPEHMQYYKPKEYEYITLLEPTQSSQDKSQQL